MLPTRDPHIVPEVLRPLPPGRDLCMGAFGVSRGAVLRQLQWWCGPRGIRNDLPGDGNTCFVNAVAQVLLRVDPIRQVLDAHVQGICRLGPRNCPVCALASQAAALSVEGDGPDQEAPLAVAVRKGLFSRMGQFRGTGQCDADQFFGRALEALGEGERGPWFPGRSAVQQHIFGVFVRNKTVCQKCMFVADHGEVKNSIFVEMNLLCTSREDEVELEDLLRRQIRLSDTISDACPSQTELSPAERDVRDVCRGGTTAKYTFWDRLPPVLFITVKRAVVHAAGNRSYDRRRVRFPDFLTLETPEGADCEYAFSGVVVHIPGDADAVRPSVESGHYIAYAVVGDNQYAEFNDGAVRNLSWNNFAKTDKCLRGAYVFAYVRSAGAQAEEVGHAARSAASGGGGGGGAASSGSVVPPAPRAAPVGPEASGG